MGTRPINRLYFFTKMATTKEKKKGILEKLDKIFSSAKSVAFVNFKGLDVENANKMRKDLRSKDVGYFVAKKTLIKKASVGKGIEGTLPNLDGEIAVSWSDDLTAPAREVNAFGKGLENGLKLVGGIFEGKFIDEVKINEIANIPSQKVLYAQFVNLINSPIQQFVMALDQIKEKKS